MKKVVLLMSTYNGERYVAEQLESLMKQTYSNIHYIIRDDASTDHTFEILAQYKEKYADREITLIHGEENAGYPGGFFQLMDMAEDADYYSFSDQDDIWNLDKVERAVTKLSELGDGVARMYFAGYDIYDAQMNFVQHSVEIKKNPKFRQSLFSCLGLGYTMVLNKKAKDLVCNIRCKQNNELAKDEWISMLISGLGEVYYDSKSCAKYRRNDGAFSISETSFLAIQAQRFKLYFKGNGFEKIHAVMQEFYDTCGNELSESDCMEIKLFTNTKYNLFRNLYKTFYPHRLRYKKVDELMLRILFLVGKV